MADVSRRAARPPRKGGRENLLFVVAAAERPPAELLGAVDEVRCVLPWGSLLRGVLGFDAAVLGGAAALLRPGGRFVAWVSLTERDRGAGVGPEALADVARLRAAYRAAGLCDVAVASAAAEELDTTGSSWWRRIHRDRRAWRIEARRTP
jgi:16S rRNA (adenine(1408)-N(1))-methyltransferase